MSTIYGRVVYDSGKTGTYSESMPGIANVPVILQNIMNGQSLAVKTDSNGSYQFYNVPLGYYQLLQGYGLVTAPPLSADSFAYATAAPIFQSAGLPPVTYVASRPPGATKLEASTPDRLLLRVTDCEITENFLVSPARISSARVESGSADLSIVKTASAATVGAGGSVTYTLTATNLGPNDATHVIINDVPPSALQNPMYSTDGGTTWSNWTGLLALDSLAVGASYSFLLRAAVGAANVPITNAATITSDQLDPVTANNLSFAMINATVAGTADLALLKSVSPTRGVVRNKCMSYTITVLNNGPGTAENITVYDSLPSAVSNGCCYINCENIPRPWTGTMNIGSLPPNGICTLRVTCRARGYSGEVFTNTATVTSTTPDPNPMNNTASVDSFIR